MSRESENILDLQTFFDCLFFLIGDITISQLLVGVVALILRFLYTCIYTKNKKSRTYGTSDLSIYLSALLWENPLPNPLPRESAPDVQISNFWQQ